MKLIAFMQLLLFFCFAVSYIKISISVYQQNYRCLDDDLARSTRYKYANMLALYI
jgi:hypothetical protein